MVTMTWYMVLPWHQTCFEHGFWSDLWQLDLGIARNPVFFWRNHTMIEFPGSMHQQRSIMLFQSKPLGWLFRQIPRWSSTHLRQTGRWSDVRLWWVHHTTNSSINSVVDVTSFTSKMAHKLGCQVSLSILTLWVAFGRVHQLLGLAAAGSIGIVTTRSGFFLTCAYYVVVLLCNVAFIHSIYCTLYIYICIST